MRGLKSIDKLDSVYSFMRYLWCQFQLLCVCLVSSLPVTLYCQSLSGAFDIGEGGEVVVTDGFVVREVAQDEGGMPFLAVGTDQGYHFLYDPNMPAVVGFWRGLFGRENASGEFQYNEATLKLFHLGRVGATWSFGERPRHALSPEWMGMEERDGQLWMRYRLKEPEGPMSWEVEETLVVESDQTQHLNFNIKPSAETELYLNYWVQQTKFKRLWTSGQQNQRNLLKNLHPNQKAFTISIFRRKETPTMPNGYSVEAIDVPSPKAPYLFEPTDLDFAENGDLYTSNRTGQVWKRSGGEWSIFAEGLHEANGIRVTDEGVYVMQRPELTLLRDTNGDGQADVYETVEDRFRFTGNYHEFAYGPRINLDGDLFFSTGLSSGANYFNAAPEGYPNQMTSPLGYRGWVMKRTSEGALIPFASGLRSPAGIGMNAQDELFITDNQGDWIASSYLGHVEEGDFLGHPSSLWDKPEFGLTPDVLDYKTVEEIPESSVQLDYEQFSKERKRPTIWLSHGDLTNSPGHPSFAPEEGFGPFAGQAFIADIAHRTIVRCALEKVAGQYQGAVFPFIRPLSSSAYSTMFDAEGNLWVGSVGRGWVAGDPAIEIIRFDPSETPFEMQRVELTKGGLDIHFTETIGSGTLKPEEILITEFEYHYWDGYGSEPVNEKRVSVKRLGISKDGKRLSLELPRREETVLEIKLPVLKSVSGLPLENDYAVYTLNRLLP